MNINWNVLVSGPDGTVIPTYGNYGGPGYSNGEVLTSPDQPVDYSAPTADSLDAAFQLHDMAYDSPDPLVRAQGDIALVEQIQSLSTQPLDPEASLYGGGAIIFGLEQAALANGHPELIDQQGAAAALNVAAADIQYGVAHLTPQDWVGVASWLNVAEGNGAASLAQSGLAAVDAASQGGIDLGAILHAVAGQLQDVQSIGSVSTAFAAEIAGEVTQAASNALSPVLDSTAAQQHVADAVAAQVDVLPDSGCHHEASFDSLVQQSWTMAVDHGWLL